MESLGVHSAVRGLAVKSSELRDFGLGLGPGGVGSGPNTQGCFFGVKCLL